MCDQIIYNKDEFVDFLDNLSDFIFYPSTDLSKPSLANDENRKFIKSNLFSKFDENKYEYIEVIKCDNEYSINLAKNSANTLIFKLIVNKR